MALHFKKPTDPPPDPYQILWGTCDTCHTVVEVKRSDATFPEKKNRDLGSWAEVPYCECQVCKAGSLAVRKGREGFGPKVYLRPKPKPASSV